MKKLLLLLFAIFLVGIIGVSAETAFTPIFCNDYEFTCCNAYNYFDDVRTKTQAEAMGCANGIYCEVTDINYNIDGSPGGYYVGSQNCRVVDTWYTSPYYYCDDQVFKQASSIRLETGQQIYLGVKTIGTSHISFRFKAYSSKLVFCGKSGCTSGIAVTGADKCKFNPDGGTIYTSTSALYGKQTVSSYTVPYLPPTNCVLAWQSGNRHICGYAEESCSVDADCGGHTYGNKECNARTLQTYGCRNYGSTYLGGSR